MSKYWYFNLIGPSHTAFKSNTFSNKHEAVRAFLNATESTEVYVWGQLIEHVPTYVTNKQDEVILTLDCPKHPQNGGSFYCINKE